MFKPVRQRLVRTHPVTGRKSLYLSSHAGMIIGWQMPEARDFLRDLNEHATRAELVYVHRWRLHTIWSMWDNRQTMHRVRRFDETRAARHAPHHGARRSDDRRAGGGGVAALPHMESPAEAGPFKPMRHSNCTQASAIASKDCARASFNFQKRHEHAPVNAAAAGPADCAACR